MAMVMEVDGMVATARPLMLEATGLFAGTMPKETHGLVRPLRSPRTPLLAGRRDPGFLSAPATPRPTSSHSVGSRALLGGTGRSLASTIGPDQGYASAREDRVVRFTVFEHAKVQSKRQVERPRYRATDTALWDAIAENTLECAAMASSAPLSGSQTATAATRAASMAVVVLVYSAPCNPFSLCDIDVLRRARAAVEEHPRTAVVGAVVVPHSDALFRQRGVPDSQKLPFNIRRDVAKTIITDQGQAKWMVVDSCMESCAHDVPSPAAYLGEYAKYRLHDIRWEVRVVGVGAEELLDGPEGSGKATQKLHVPFCPSRGGGGSSPDPEEGPLVRPLRKEVATLGVDVPKKAHLDELLSSSLRQIQDHNCYLVLERLCGSAGAGLIRAWISSRSVGGISRRRR